MLSYTPRNINFFIWEMWWKGLFFFNFSNFFLPIRNQSRGFRELPKEKVIHSVLHWLIIFFASLQLTPKPLTIQKYSYNSGDTLEETILGKRAESDSQTGQLLPWGSKAETTSISMKCWNSYAEEEVTQNRDIARNWGLRHPVRYKTLTSTWTKETKQCRGNKLYKFQLAVLDTFSGDGGWGPTTYVQQLFNR